MFKKLLLVTSMFAGIGSVQAQEMQVQTSYPTAYTQIGNFNISWAYSAINLNAAKTANATGKGVTVAVFDTGINPNNVKFSNLVTGWNLYCNNKAGCAGVTKDNQWHGTFVSGIIAANMLDVAGQTMYGVAPDAKIMPIQILDANGNASFTDAQLAKAINYSVTNGAKVLNNSWNSSLTLATMGAKANTVRIDYMNELAAWKNAAAKGALIVFAAGNYGLKDPGFYGTMPTSFTGLDKNWITVVATDQTGALASYSNACGIAAAYCMAAPGSNIIGLYGNSVAIGSGTSFAAPIVSGAAAMLYQYFPFLTGSDIQKILFTTADKTGIYANTAIYGQGMLDLTKAFQPVGTLTVATTATVSGSKTSISGAYVAPSGAFGSSIATALSKTEVMLLDDFNRDYYVDLSGGVISADTFNHWDDQLSMFGADEITTDNTTVITGQYNGNFSSFVNVNTELGFDISYGTNTSAGLAYGPFANGSIRGSDIVMLNSVGNPYLNMAPNGFNSAIGYNWNDSDTTRIGLFTNTMQYDSVYSEFPYMNDAENTAYMNGAVVEQTHKWKNGYISANVGFVNEHNSVLGSYSNGALSMGDNANTVFGGVNAGFDITDKVSVFGGANIGYTMVDTADGSMITDVNNLTSGNAYVGITKIGGVFGDDDRFGLIAGMPFRVNTGSAELKVPTSRDLEGNVEFDNMNVDLASDSYDFTTQAFYSAKLDDNQSFAVGIGAKFNTDDISNTEVIGMARYKLNF